MKHIAIIGSGIVGASCAYYLSKDSDYRITLIDDGEGQASKAACGIICPWLSQRRNKVWYHLVKEGAEFYSKLMLDLQGDGIKDLPYVQTGTLVFKKTHEQLNKLMAIAEQRRMSSAKIGECKLIASEDIHKTIPNYYGNQGAILAQGGGRVDGELLVKQLNSLAVANGTEIINGKAQLIDETHIEIYQQQYKFDQIILTTGAWLPELLKPLGYQVDVRPQKGQLLEVITEQQTDSLPGMMLHGEIDILPFDNNRLIIGATHENNKGYDLQPDYQLLNQMKDTANDFLPVGNYHINKVRVGIRAYTSDYQPFFGYIRQSSLLVASGLGSSGLTSGPLIGYLLACLVSKQNLFIDINEYSPNKYIKKITFQEKNLDS